MESFEKAYAKLNARQREAVDTIDGPVMVIAGPGTGKTQLLSTRVGNIVAKGASEPRNILCLTYADAGRVAMQERLNELIGEAGNQVAVHTFHSFGSEIISTHPEHFDQGATLAAADELTTHEILQNLLLALPHSSPLASKFNGEFTHLKSLAGTIGDLKKAAVTPEELRRIAKHNLSWLKEAEPLLTKLFDVARFTGKDAIQAAEKTLIELEAHKDPGYDHPIIRPLSLICLKSMAEALQIATEQGKTTPLNNWKKPWFGKDEHGRPICPQVAISRKLLVVADVYEKYQEELSKRGLYDFDDMIMRVVTTLEAKPDLTFDLQEQYHYFLIDEFQDTNGAQLRLLKAIADHSVHEGKPNIMVVGDDDQAIYAFQGAELSNMLDFTRFYPATKVVTLTENYRSAQAILDVAREVIIQGSERLEQNQPEIDKTLTAENEPENFETSLLEAPTLADELRWVAKSVKEKVNGGSSPSTIAVISREHKYLTAIAPYLHDEKLFVTYKRRDSVLNHPKIKELLTLVRVVDHLARAELREANSLMPELLSFAFFEIPPEDLWSLSLEAYNSRDNYGNSKLWLEIMRTGSSAELKVIAQWLSAAAQISLTTTAEEALDLLIGNEQAGLPDDEHEESDDIMAPRKIDSFVSPFKHYYFNEQALKSHPADYLNVLYGLTAIRNTFRRYHPDEQLSLHEFLQFIELHLQAGISIASDQTYRESQESIQLLTAHGSKGLEFEHVFVLEANKNVWEGRSRSSAISLSQNLIVIRSAGNTDDNLRLLYVALTRARSGLYVGRSLAMGDGKPQLPLSSLTTPAVKQHLTALSSDTNEHIGVSITEAQRDWRDSHWRLAKSTMSAQLAPVLQNYQLSATHFNNFLDVTRGGPRAFLLDNLLHFPEALSAQAAYGSAMHAALEKLHNHMSQHKVLLSPDELIRLFTYFLRTMRLNPIEETQYIERGKNALGIFLANYGSKLHPGQLSEQKFAHQGVKCGEARLTGKLDVLEVTGKNVKVIDYKTGKQLLSWSPGGKSQFDKLKAHRYRQQLLFYTLLIKGARDFGANGLIAHEGELVFVEPDKDGKIIHLPLELSGENIKSELLRLEQLIAVVWQRIQKLDFPDTSHYSKDLNGVTEFENDLLK